MKFELKVLELEGIIRAMRLEIAKEYLLESGINPDLLLEQDKTCVYSALELKANKYKHENLKKLGVDISK